MHIYNQNFVVEEKEEMLLLKFRRAFFETLNPLMTSVYCENFERI